MKRNKRTYILSLFVLAAWTLFGQGKVAINPLDLTKLPQGINYEGQIKTAVRWTDSLGDNIAILTETGVFQNKKSKHEDGGQDAELFAYHYLVKADSAFQTWRVYDFISDCPLDVEARFIKNAFQVTDLNQDGISEVWLMYKTACHGDISPCDMKIIMYQGQQKYAMRGHNKVKVSEKEFYGGDYKFDTIFQNGLKIFRDFAKKMWDKNILQTWGE